MEIQIGTATYYYYVVVYHTGLVQMAFKATELRFRPVCPDLTQNGCKRLD